MREDAAAFDRSDRNVTFDTVPITCAFSIFDGTPSENSPWARFIDCDDDDDECNIAATGEPSSNNDADIGR